MAMTEREKVIQIQGDKLCEYLGYKKGTKIPLETIRMIAQGKFGENVLIDGQPVTLSMHMIGVAGILFAKITGGRV